MPSYSFVKKMFLSGVLLSLVTVAPSAFAQGDVPVLGKSLETDQPIEISADKLEYLKDEDRYRADGSVTITRGDLNLTADHVILNNKTGLIFAEGGVILDDGEDTLSSDVLEFNFLEKTGVAVPGSLFIEEENLYLRATRLAKTSELRYDLEGWQATACETEEGKSPLWHIRGRKASAELGGYLVARDVRFYIKKVPVFYTPFFFLPLKTERQSGLLIPQVGGSTLDGLRYNQSLFWAISPSQDATISLDYRSLRGVGGELEYRYKLSRDSEGGLIAKLFEDKIEDKTRTELQYYHVRRFTRDFQSKLNVHLVNDIDQFRDLDDSTAGRIQQSLYSSFVVFHRWDNQEVYLQAQFTKDLLSESQTTLQKIPEIGYRIIEYRLGPLPVYAGLESTAVYFWRDDEDEANGLIRAKRLDAYPRVTGRLKLAGLVITPHAGYRATWYSRQVDSNASKTRGVGVYGVGANTRLVRTFKTGGGARILHQVQPDLEYEYVPFVDQSTIPHFDDVDQLPRKNDLTYSLTNRMVFYGAEEKDGPFRREIIFLKLTQSYDLHAKRTRQDPGPSRPLSNVRSEGTLRPFQKVTLDLEVFYNFYRDETVAFNSDLGFDLAKFWIVSVGQRYTRKGALLPRGEIFNVLSQVEENFWFNQSSPMIRFWTAKSRMAIASTVVLKNEVFYDSDAKKLAEAFYGLEFIGQCWGFEVNYQDLPDKNQFSFMLTLRSDGTK